MSQSSDPSGGLSLEIVREFGAPLAQVFGAFSDPEILARWWGPEGYEVSVSRLDFQPGGSWRSCLRAEDGKQMCMGGEYREIVPNQRIVFTFAWEDADGKPFPGTLVEALFEEAQNGTRMTFRQTGFPSEATRNGHIGGWTSCFDRLAIELANSNNPGGSNV